MNSKFARERDYLNSETLSMSSIRGTPVCQIQTIRLWKIFSFLFRLKINKIFMLYRFSFLNLEKWIYRWSNQKYYFYQNCPRNDASELLFYLYVFYSIIIIIIFYLFVVNLYTHFYNEKFMGMDNDLLSTWTSMFIPMPLKEARTSAPATCDFNLLIIRRVKNYAHKQNTQF